MTVHIVHRPARATQPLEGPAEIVLAPPPPVGDSSSPFPIQSMLPILGSLSSITMIVLLRNNPVMVVVGAVILVVALVGGVGMAFTARGNAARQRRIQRERYLDYLEQQRATVREIADARRDASLALDPAPATLVQIGANPARRWERRPGDPDFLRVRIGTGDLRAVDVRLPPEQNPVQPFDPVMKSAAARLVQLAGVAQGLPALLDLERGGHVSIVGPREDTIDLCRAIAAQIGALHSPDDVHLAAVVPEHALDLWHGLDLLPHASSATPPAGQVAARRIAPTLPELMTLLSDELRDRVTSAAATRRSGRRTKPARLVIFLDEGTDAASPLPRLDAALDPADLGITVVHVVDDRLKEPPAVSARVTLADGTATIETPGSGEDALRGIRPDRVPTALLEVVARPLAALRLTRTSAVDAQSTFAPDVTELLGIADVDAFDLGDAWRSRSAGDFLRVPIGVDDRGAPVLLDLKESARLGMGPHGICIGATGSGKSELLRTLILGLALTHSPDDLSMILVDYKGGAAFAPFAGLPHVAGIIDNLADDPQLTERARASIQGEVVRRQRLLKDAGNAASIGHYRQLRRERPDLPALPHLFLVIDEFGELLTAEPDFVELLLTIGRIGRSIGVHLLLSSQRIEGGRLRGLDTYLSYRIGLRTFSESESAVVLDTPDAFHLPAIPGFGYLKVDTSVYTRFRAGYVSGPVPSPAEAGPARSDMPPLVELPPYDRAAAEDSEAPIGALAEPEAPATGRTLVQAAASRLTRGVARTRPVWLPPLPPVLTLGGVLSAVENRGGLQAPLGLLDDPARQQQAPWLLDLTRSGGHVAITGAPQSGRSTFLRTLAASLAFTHSPREVSVYGMDLTGGGLARIEPFPHVGGVATRGHRERLSRLLEELTGMLAVRERVFREHGLDSLADMRRQHAAGRLPELPSADVILLVDGLGALRAEFEDLEAPFGQLLERGGSFGIHVVVTLARWNELRLNLQGLVGTRLELKLNDPADSQIARKLASTLRADEPGRALTDDRLFAQIALPLLEEVDDADIGDALERIARESAAQWSGPGAAPIRLLPEDFSPDDLPDALDEPELIPVGLRQDTMTPAVLDLAARDPHLLVLGDSRCGKTTVLRGVTQGAIDRHSPEELVIALMDARGELVGDIPDDYLGGHATSGRQARLLAESIATELEKRAVDRTAGGPRILVIADDFDILAAGGAEPLRPLLPYLASARDLRLNVVVSRPVAGASRAMFDVALQGVRDTGGTALIMSGDRAEGQLLPKLYAEPMVAGRGRLARRGERPTLVQIARFEQAPTDAAASPLADVDASSLPGRHRDVLQTDEIPPRRRRRRAETP
ncbi:type VII secretion protein EccCa [Microbacterium sp. BK668]|uniref:type VII secretion protein EccCa n=1 Tax=Microbacterium sp. BK668 TaxID=2512118 RepID=UPI0010622033|nr:type VII secretion protein EccCa [Microbacterium sp. BK668]TDN91328.1 S-DNA-T family DNA segregation ATPase FtsK/SpoIIIE [Microbacterium sp. BK668]